LLALHASAALVFSHRQTLEDSMTIFRLAGAVAALVAIAATPVLAQQVISEPGYCAFFYPNANCQNKGPGNPYTNGGYYQANGWQNGNAVGQNGYAVAQPHRRWHRHQHAR
jgi:hypothetical protein